MCCKKPVAPQSQGGVAPRGGQPEVRMQALGQPLDRSASKGPRYEVPEGPSTQYSWSFVPTTVYGMVLGARSQGP